MHQILILPHIRLCQISCQSESRILNIRAGIVSGRIFVYLETIMYVHIIKYCRRKIYLYTH